MQFKGHLLLPDESGPGLSVNLDVAEHHLAVESEGGGLGAWPLEVVDVERLHGDVFTLTVAGEPLRFIADDTIAFTYSGVPSIARVSSRSRKRSTFRSKLNRIWSGPDQPAVKVRVPPAADETPNAPGLTEAELAPDSPATSPPAVLEAAVDSLVDLGNQIESGEDLILPDPMSESPPTDEDLAAAPGCPAIRSDGRRCESPILTSSGYCYPHDPKRAFENKYNAAQLARAQLKQDATAKLNRIYSRLDKAMRQVERGELDPETAMAMAQLARTMCAILDLDEPSPGKDR